MSDSVQLPNGATFTRLPAMPARGAMFESGLRRPKAKPRMRPVRLRWFDDLWSENDPKEKRQKNEMLPFTRTATQKLQEPRPIPSEPAREHQRRTP
jgi:hypothetical protein